MFGEKKLSTLIKSMSPVLSDDKYVYCCLVDTELIKLNQLQPLATYQEKEGLTVILNKNQADEYDINYNGVYKCITLTVHSSLDAVGLTAAVATKLTENNISANVMAAYYHDHIFVSVHDADKALKCLIELTEDGQY